MSLTNLLVKTYPFREDDGMASDRYKFASTELVTRLWLNTIERSLESETAIMALRAVIEFSNFRWQQKKNRCIMCFKCLVNGKGHSVQQKDTFLFIIVD